MNRLVPALLLILLPVLPLQAQAPARLTGQVVDQSTGAPVPYPRVRLGADSRDGDAQGRFRFEAVTAGYLRLWVGALGYAAAERPVDITPGESVSLTVALRAAPVALEPLIANAAAGGATITGVALQTRGRTLAQALDGWQGLLVVRRDGAGPAEPQAPGGGPDELLVTVDGFPLNDPLTGRADLGQISTRDVERVRLASGVQTTGGGGRAVSGVLAITTRSRLSPQASLWAGSNQSRGARVALSRSGLSASLSIEQSPRDFGYTTPGGGEATRLNAGGTLYRLHLRTEGSWETTLRASASDRGLPGTTTNPTPAADASDRSAFLGLSHRGTVDLKASAQWLRTRARDGNPPPGFIAYDAATEGVGFSAEFGWHRVVTLAGWRGQYRLGADARHDRFRGDAVRSGASFTRGGAGLGLDLERGALRLSPSLRVDGWSGAAKTAVSARLDAALQRGPTRITVGLGSGTSIPVLADLLFREGVGVRVNPDLRPERVQWEASAGLSREIRGAPGAIRVDLDGSIAHVADMVLWSPDFRFVWSPQNFDVWRRLASLGMEWRPMAALLVSGHTQWSAVTYDTPGGAQVRYRPRFTQTLGASWSPPGWRLGAWWHHLGRRFPNSAGTNPLPPLDVLDLSLERALTEALRLQLALNDLTDARPEYIAGYPTPGRSLSLTIALDLP